MSLEEYKRLLVRQGRRSRRALFASNLLGWPSSLRRRS